MYMPDVNVLVYAHRTDASPGKQYAEWVVKTATSAEPFALSEPVLQGFVRVVTNPRTFTHPSTLDEAFQFIDELLARPNCRLLRPGPKHWMIFREICEGLNIRGKLVADAAHAALAIESGCTWVSADTDFARFAPALRWQHL